MMNRYLTSALLLIASIFAPSVHSMELFAGVNLATMSHEGVGYRDYECPVWPYKEFVEFTLWRYCLFDYSKESSNFGYLRFGAKFNKYVSGELRTGLSRTNSGVHYSCTSYEQDSNITELIERFPYVHGTFGAPCFEGHIDLDSIIFAGGYVRLNLPIRPWLQPYTVLGYTGYSYDIGISSLHVYPDPVIANLLKPLKTASYKFTYGIGLETKIPALKRFTFHIEYSNNDSFGATSIGITYSRSKWFFNLWPKRARNVDR